MVCWKCSNLFPRCRIAFDVWTELRRWERPFHIDRMWMKVSWAFVMAQWCSMSGLSMTMLLDAVHGSSLDRFAFGLNNPNVPSVDAVFRVSVGCLPFSTALLFDDPIAPRSILSFRWSFAFYFLHSNQRGERFELLFFLLSSLVEFWNRAELFYSWLIIVFKEYNPQFCALTFTSKYNLEASLMLW